MNSSELQKYSPKAASAPAGLYVHMEKDSDEGGWVKAEDAASRLQAVEDDAQIALLTTRERLAEAERRAIEAEGLVVALEGRWGVRRREADDLRKKLGELLKHARRLGPKENGRPYLPDTSEVRDLIEAALSDDQLAPVEGEQVVVTDGHDE